MAKFKAPTLSSTQLKLWSVALISVGLLAFGVAWQVFEDRKATIEQSERDIGQLASNLEASTESTFDAARLITDHIGTMALVDGGAFGVSSPETQQNWIAILKEQEYISALSLIRPDGISESITVRSIDGVVRNIVRTEDINRYRSFNIHLQDNDIELYVGDLRQGIEVDRWFLPLTRPIRNDDGDLLGVVFVGIAVDAFLDLYSNVLPAGTSSVALYHHDGRLLFSYPFEETLLGMSFADRSLFTEHLKTSPFGTYHTISPIGGDKRVFSYRSAVNYPLVMAVDASLANILDAWTQRAIIYGVVLLAASAVIIALTAWLSVQVYRDEHTRRILRISEQSLETSQRMAGIGHFNREIRTNDFVWSESMYRIHGVTPDTFDPDRDTYLDLVIEEDYERVERSVRHADRPPTTGQLECRIRRPDGAVRDMRYDWQVIKNEDGSPTRVFGIAQDITQLRESENAVRENEARLRDITECISDFVWEADQTGVLTHFDSGNADIKVIAVLGETRDENIDHAAGGGDWPAMVQAVENRAPYRNLVIPFKDTEGKTRWIRISANPKYDKDGSFIGWRGAGSDITEQRLQTISQNEKSKSDALARLAGGMAHEINNLLQPVVVYSSIGEKEEADRKQIRQYFKRIYAATQQAMDIVKDVLTFAREGHEPSAPVDLTVTLSQSVDLIRPTLPHSVTVSGPYTDELIDVGAQSNGLHQVAVNLIRNAVDAACDQLCCIVIEVGTLVLYPSDAERRTVLPGRYGFFKVIDDGPGIDEGIMDKIFDPFFTTKPVGSGTGLGLSVVAGLVKEWSGAVDVQSQPGRTAFTVYIPVVEQSRQAAE